MTDSFDFLLEIVKNGTQKQKDTLLKILLKEKEKRKRI
jgi:hypothetical protein